MNDQRSVLDMPLVRAILGLSDDVLSCDECQAWLPSYVDAEISGVAGAPRYHPVKCHLLLCRDCTEVYLELLEMALAEEEDRLPRPERYPEPDLSFLPEEEDRDE